jgi:hypothetical protein
LPETLETRGRLESSDFQAFQTLSEAFMIPHRISLLALGLCLALPAFSRAKEVELGSKPVEVTVFPRGARVVRAAQAELPEGSTTVVFSDLPADADPASLRLSAEEIGRASCRERVFGFV